MEKALQQLIMNIANLLKVKTIITITVISFLTVGFMKGIVPSELYASIAMAIVTFYFTKKEDNKNEEEKIDGK